MKKHYRDLNLKTSREAKRKVENGCEIAYTLFKNANNGSGIYIEWHLMKSR